MAGWALQRTSGASLLLLSLPLLGVARLLPADGFGLWLRLVAASLVVLLPGAIVARALRLRGVSATAAWAVAALVPALLVVFLVHTSIWVALVVLGCIGVAALPFAYQIVSGPPTWDTLGVALVGLAFGVALWHVSGVLHGDALFHLGRVRKLDSFSSLHVRSVDEFANGGLHPGYAFPIWYGFLALVAKLAGVDPTQVMLHEPSAIAPIAFAVVYESGVALFRSAWLGLCVLIATVAGAALAPGHGGSFVLLAQPGTVDRQVLAPAALTIFFLAVREPSWRLLATLAALGGSVFLTHTTTAVFLLLPLAGFLVVRWLLTRKDVRSGLLAFGALVLPAALALAWIAPIVDETRSHSPGPAELRRSLAKYATELHVDSLHRYALRPEVVARGGAIAVASLLCIPLGLFASRRRWGAFVLGGSLVVLVLELTPWLFPHFADSISLSQARRAAGFVPFAFALAGGAAVLTRLIGVFALPVALGAGVALQSAYPGGFGQLAGSGPGIVTWIALAGAAIAVVLGLVRRWQLERRGPLAALAVALFALPVVIHGFAHWTPARTKDPYMPSPGLLAAMRKDVPKRAVVFSDLETSYRISAYLPVYVASAPPAHVADTKANNPYGRRYATNHYFATGDIRIPERLLATWIVIDRRRFHVRPPWKLVYSDARYSLYHRPA